MYGVCGRQNDAASGCKGQSHKSVARHFEAGLRRRA